MWTQPSPGWGTGGPFSLAPQRTAWHPRAQAGPGSQTLLQSHKALGTSPGSAGPGTLQLCVPCRGGQELALMAPLPSMALCSPVTMLSHLLINQADCNVFLGH